jgi:hypothetical protein
VPQQKSKTEVFTSRKERAATIVAAKKCHDKNNHLQYSYYAITQTHFATTVLSSESCDSNLPFVISTLDLDG